MALGGITLAPLITQIKVDISNFKNQMQQAATAGVTAAKQMSDKMSKLANVGQSMTNIGQTMTKKVTVPILAASGACTKFAIDAETSFAKVSTILDTTKVSTEELKKGVISASNESGIAVTDFNEALYESLSAGIDSGNAIKFTTDMAKLAKGGFTETSKAVDVVTSVLNAYGLSADQATSISDKLITTQNIGKTTVDELASSLGRVIPTANAFGVGIDDVSTALSQLTKNGIQTAEATTYYNSMLNELGSSGTIASKAIKEKLGASFTELMKKGVPLTDVLKTLKEKATESGLSLSDMFGSSEAAKAALTIMKDDGVEYNDILNQMKNSAGATQKAFETMDATPAEKLKKALNSLKNAAIQFGGAFTPIIEKVASVIKTLGEKLQSLTPAQQEFIAKTGLVVAAIGPLLTIVGKAITLYTTLKPAIAGISAAFTAASASGGALSAVITALTGPIGLVIAAAVALSVAIATNFGGIRDTIMSVLNSIKTFIDSVVGAIKYAWENNFLGIKTYTETVFNMIATVVNTVLNVIKGVFDAFSAAFRGDWQGCWEAVKGIANTVWEGIKTLIGQALNGIVDIILNIAVQVYSAALTVFGKAKEGATNAWNALMAWLKGAVNDPVGTIKGIGTALFNAGKNVINNLLSGFKSAWSSVTSWFDNKVQWIKDKLSFINASKRDAMPDGSHYNGLAYVPFDGYNARLHKGERVLTAEENKAYNKGQNGNGSGTVINIENFNNNRKSDVKQLAEELEFYRKK